MYRKITNEELANLSKYWENSTVDTSKYYQNVYYAAEVNKEEYEQHKREGGLCQIRNNRYYIA